MRVLKLLWAVVHAYNTYTILTHLLASFLASCYIDPSVQYVQWYCMQH